MEVSSFRANPMKVIHLQNKKNTSDADIIFPTMTAAMDHNHQPVVSTKNFVQSVVRRKAKLRHWFNGSLTRIPIFHLLEVEFMKPSLPRKCLRLQYFLSCVVQVTGRTLLIDK